MTAVIVRSVRHDVPSWLWKPRPTVIHTTMGPVRTWPPRLVVIGCIHTATPVTDIVSPLNKCSCMDEEHGLSAHAIIKGEAVYLVVRESDMCTHVCGHGGLPVYGYIIDALSLVMLIAHDNSLDESLDVGALWCAQWCARYNIPITRVDEVTPNAKGIVAWGSLLCDNFPVDYILQRATGAVQLSGRH